MGRLLGSGWLAIFFCVGHCQKDSGATISGSPSCPLVTHPLDYLRTVPSIKNDIEKSEAGLGALLRRPL